MIPTVSPRSPLPAFTECTDAAGHSLNTAIFNGGLHPAAAVRHAAPVTAPSRAASEHRGVRSRRARGSVVALVLCALLAVAAVAAGAAPASESPLVVYSNYTLSVARQYLAATSVSNLALFGGGSASNVVDIFNSVSGLWTTATLSGARWPLAATTVRLKPGPVRGRDLLQRRGYFQRHLRIVDHCYA